MPRIQHPCAIESTVTGWNRPDLNNPSVLSLKPKFETSDVFKAIYGRLPYRYGLNMAQIYTGDSRKDYLAHLNKCLHKFPGDLTLQLRWRVSKEIPAFSMEFLQLYLSRFGKVEAIYQQALNSCLVIFKDEQSARAVANNRSLGLPYGRLYSKWWKPPPQDDMYFAIMKHIEKSAETRTRFHSLMDRDDRLSCQDPLRASTRDLATANKTGGPNLHAYLYDGVKIAESLRKPKPPSPKMERRYDTINLVSTTSEMRQLVEEDRLTVVDFCATWCGPCRAISPVLETLSVLMPDVRFIKIDVDRSTELAEEYNVSALPTFQFFRKGKKLDHIVGAKPDLLKEKVAKLRENP